MRDFFAFYLSSGFDHVNLFLEMTDGSVPDAGHITNYQLSGIAFILGVFFVLSATCFFTGNVCVFWLVVKKEMFVKSVEKGNERLQSG